MYSEWFSTTAPAYQELVTRLYGAETGERLNRAYCDELSNRDCWSHRLEWSGVAVYEAGEVKAHAIVQVIHDKPLAYVGYVEALNDPAAAAVLVHEIRAELRHKHPGRAVYLPVNQSIWHTYRFKTSGDCVLPFEPPCQPYYGEMFARLFETKELYSSYRMAVPAAYRLEGIELPFSVRELSAARLPQELKAIYALAVSTFQDSHSFPSFAEFAALYGGAAGTINLRYVLVAEALETTERGAGTSAPGADLGLFQSRRCERSDHAPALYRRAISPREGDCFGAKSAPRNDEDHKVSSVSTDNGKAPLKFPSAAPANAE
jgi:hypothetical protein